MSDESTSETEQNRLDWWECALCGDTGNEGIRACPSCGSMQIDPHTGGVDLPPCWKEDSRLAGALAAQRVWVHLDGPGFIGLRDNQLELVRADLQAGEDPDPETRPPTAENVHALAEKYNDEFYGEDMEGAT